MKCKLDDICKIAKGNTAISKASPGKYPLVVTAEKRKTCNNYQFEEESVLIPLVSSTGHGHASINRIHYQIGKFALGSILCAVIPKSNKIVLSKYLHIYLSTYKDKIIVPLMKGSANVSLTLNKVKSIVVEVPSIIKQKEIIEKEKSVKIYNQKLLGKVSGNIESILEFRTTILNDAIQGRLVPQDKKDDPASELIKKIKTEKEKLIQEKKIKKEKPLSPIKTREIPFELPKMWTWCRLGELGNAINFPIVDGPFGSSVDTKKDYIEKGIPVIRMKNIKPMQFLDNDLKYINESKFKKLKRHNILPKDVLFSKVGAGIGEACIFPEKYREAMLSTTGVTRFRVGSVVLPKYLLYFLLFYKNKFVSMASQTAQPFLNMSMIKNVAFALPPFEEQKRIVAKVGQLMKLCDDLEKKSKESKQHSEHLMGAVLREAFEE